ncbi:hypothetical protein D3C81_1040390 [compost metagenome]
MNKTLLEVLDEARHKDHAAIVVPSLRGLSKSTLEFINKHRLWVFGAYDSSNANGGHYKEDIPEFDVARGAALEVYSLHVWNVPMDHEAITYMRGRMRGPDGVYEIHLYYTMAAMWTAFKPDGK